MSAPVIVSVEPAEAHLNPGDHVDVTVTAQDPESASGIARFTVADSRGEVSLATVQLTVDNPLSFGTDIETDPADLPVSVQLIQSGPTSATYRITAS